MTASWYCGSWVPSPFTMAGLSAVRGSFFSDSERPRGDNGSFFSFSRGLFRSPLSPRRPSLLVGLRGLDTPCPVDERVGAVARGDTKALIVEEDAVLRVGRSPRGLASCSLNRSLSLLLSFFLSLSFSSFLLLSRLDIRDSFLLLLWLCF